MTLRRRAADVLLSGALLPPGVPMFRHSFPILFALAFVTPLFTGCGSTSESSMSPADKNVWTDARGRHGVGVLDDHNFKVELVPTGETKGDPDTLEFAGGRFHSTACDQYGFGSGEYTTTQVEGGWRFHATCRNGGGGTNEWYGTVRGDSIEGGFTCTNPDSPTMRGNFRGNAVK
jgi:hypothetical protein